MSYKDVIAKFKAEDAAKKLISGEPQSSSASVHNIYSEPPSLQDLLEDDSTFNFRLNGVLKKEFLLLCKRDHLSAASALKRYMTECVQFGMIK